jgi:hypothetical protein
MQLRSLTAAVAHVLQLCPSWMKKCLNMQEMRRTCLVPGQEPVFILSFNDPRFFGLMNARLTTSGSSAPSRMNRKS